MRTSTRKIRKIASIAERDQTPHYLTLRGGRMTKVAGVAASFAPTLGSLGAGVSAIALGAALMLGGEAHAQANVVETLVNTEDPAGNDTPIELEAPLGDFSLTASTAPGFGINTSNSSSPAIALYSFDGYGDVNLIDENNSNITGGPVGIYGRTDGDGNISISVSGNVTGNEVGVQVTTGRFEDEPDDEWEWEADFAEPFILIGGETTGDLYVSVQNAEGTAQASGESAGISGYQNGSGSLTIKADNATSINGSGVEARNTNGGGIEISVINAYGDDNGIFASNTYDNDEQQHGGGIEFQFLTTPSEAAPNSITISASGNVISNVGYGIYARNETYGDITIDATNEAGDASVDGDYVGIYAQNTGPGSIVVSANNVTSYYGYAIRVRNGYRYDDRFDTRSAVAVANSEPQFNGIPISSGEVTITATGNVTSEYGGGIDAYNYGYGDLTVDATNEEGTAVVNSAETGIQASNRNGGDVFVYANNVYAGEGDAINASNRSYYLDRRVGQLTLSEGEKPNSIGYYIPVGDITVRTSGNIISEDSDGIDVNNEVRGDVIIDASNEDGTGQVTGEDNGMEVDNDGGGDVTITANNVTGEFGDGIEVDNRNYRYARECFMCITQNDLSSPAESIGAMAYYGQPGDVTITVSGLVSGGLAEPREYEEGQKRRIRERGYGSGINVENQTGGSIFITSENEDGTAVVEGQYSGIIARNYSYGGRFMVPGIETDYAGPTPQVIDIHAQTVTGGYSSGIAAYNFGYGRILTARHPSEDGGTDAGGIFIEVTNGVTGGLSLPDRDEEDGEFDLEIREVRMGPIFLGGSGDNGITAVQMGPGNIDIDVTNEDGSAYAIGHDNGIMAFNSYGNITIDVDNAEGQYQAGVSAFTAGFYGLIIGVPNSPAAAPLATEEVLEPFTPPANDITITSTGIISGGTEETSDLLRPYRGPFSFFGGADGINAVNLTAGDITITSANEEGTAEVNGHRTGILAIKGNEGDISITANTVEGENFHGILAANSPIFGYYYGPGRYYFDSPALAIDAETDGPKIPEGNITVSVSGTVTGGLYAGLAEYEIDDGPGVPLPTEAEEEERGNFNYNPQLQYGGVGVIVYQSFIGDVNVTVANEDGTASANGALYGVAAGTRYGGGDTNITVDNANGDEGSGVAVYHAEEAGDITVTTNGEVTGGRNGIWTVNEGTGNTTISVGGVTEGGSNTGILAIGQDGTLATITLRDGADVSGGDYAIFNNGSDSETTLEAGSKLSGDSKFGDGDDNLTIEGDADIADVTLLDADGDDEPVVEGDPEVVALATEEADDFVDILTFDGFTGTVEATTALENWEEGVFKGGDATLDLAELNIPEVTLLEDAQVSVTDPSFTLNGDLAVQSGTFNAGVGGTGDVMVMGDVNNEGLISLANDNPGDMLTISGHFSGNGDLAFDVDFAGTTNDMVDVGGDVTGQKSVDINGIGNATEANEYTLVNVGGSSADDSFDLANPNAVNSDGDDAIANGAFLYTLDRRAATNTFVLTPFDSAGATQFNPSVPIFEAVPSVFTDLAGLDDFLSRFQSQGGNSGTGGVSQALLDFSTKSDMTFYTRITGQQSDRDLTNILRTNVDTTSTELSMGFDVPMYEGSMGTLFGGFNFAYLDSDSSITSFAGVGSVDSETFGYTFSAFYLTDSGFYVDGRYRFSFFDSSIVVASGLGALGLVTEGTANSASLEVGKLIGLSNGLTLIPQLQVQHVDVGSDPLVDPLTGTSEGVLTDGATTTGRVGLWVERALAQNSVFGSVSIFHDFDGTTTTNFAGIPFSSKREETRLELGVGGELAVGTNSTVFGRVFAAGGLGDWTADETYTATAGFRLNF